MKKSLVWALVGLALSVSTFTASAADVYRGTPGYNWTGFYLGGNVGYGKSDFKESYRDPFTSRDYAVNSKGTVFGIQAMYLHEFDNKVVLGAATDLNLGGGSGGRTLDNCPGCFPVTSITNEVYKRQSSGNTRMVLGYDMGKFMPYVTGGVAYASFKGSATTTLAVGGVPISSYNTTNTMPGVGYTLGAGAMYRINPSWTLEAKYLWTDYRLMKVSDSFPSTVTDKVSSQTLTIGLNYKF